MMDQPKKQYKEASKLELKEIKKDSPKEFKKIQCPSCHGEINADHLNLQNIIAKCGSCNVIFSIEKEVESLKTKNEMKQDIFRPEGIELFHFKDDLEITVKQHIQGWDAFGIIFAPFLAAFTIFIYFTKGCPAFIPISLTLGALYFIYKAFNYSKYKTFIDINDKYLNIYHRPKNLRKDQSYEASEIDQLYLKYAPDGQLGVYMIINGLKGQQHRKLINVNTISKAKYLEQEIERYLNIEDRKVPEANA